MSLISEALRKAHIEALQQDRDQRRFYMNHGGRPGHSADGSSRTSIAIIVLTVLCFISAGALVYLTLERSPAPEAAAHPVTVAVPSHAPEMRVEEAAAVPRATAAPGPQKKTSVAKKEGPQTKVVEAGSDTAARSAPTAVLPAERRLIRDGFREGETYGSPVLGPLGSEVALTGITALRGQHVAIVNGTLVRAGAAVGPFVIEDIEPRRVRLRYVDVSFYLVQ